jgi:thiol-disulfide isomerase/thioredoxin
MSRIETIFARPRWPFGPTPPRARVRLGGLVALAVIAATLASAEVKIGDPFPSLQGAGLEGRVPDTAGCVVLVDFWASWCAPCRAAFSSYARLQGDYAARGLVIVAVSVDRGAEAYAAFVRRMAPSFAVVRDGRQQFVQQVHVPAMPTCFLIDREGRVRFLHAGFHGDETDRDIRKEVEKLLAETSNPP